MPTVPAALPHRPSKEQPMIKNLAALRSMIDAGEKKTCAVACAHDAHAQCAGRHALEETSAGNLLHVFILLLFYASPISSGEYSTFIIYQFTAISIYTSIDM